MFSHLWVSGDSSRAFRKSAARLSRSADAIAISVRSLSATSRACSAAVFSSARCSRLFSSSSRNLCWRSTSRSGSRRSWRKISSPRLAQRLLSE